MERVPGTTSSPPARSHPLRLAVVLLGVFALVMAALAGPAAAKPRGKAHDASRAHGPVRTVDVMTRNLYLGADLTSIVTALGLDPADPNAVVQAATQTWQQVVDSDPEERMAAIAKEIVATKPEAVGLQEVTQWATYDYNPLTGEPSNRQVAYEFLDLLLEALHDRGMSYREVSGATSTNFTSPPIPILAGEAYPTKAVQLVDRDVIIVRGAVRAANPRSGNFKAILGPPQFPLPAARGWGSADLRYKRANFRFVNSHTEAFSPESLRVAEVQELLDAQALITEDLGALPTVYAGDYNSAAPNADAYRTLLAAGLHDLWSQARPRWPARWSNTCCQDADLANRRSDLTTRIDLLLGTRGVRAVTARRTGVRRVNLPGDTWWASDHAGVVAKVKIPIGIPPRS